MKPIENWNRVFNQILPKVKKPARYAGQERNIIIKDLDQVDATIALAFPDLYDIGMSYYGFQILYHILNQDKSIAAERVYAPWPDFEEELRKNSIPLYTLESHVSLDQFDVVGFSFSYELGYTNMLNMLNLGNIPIFQSDRSDSDPIVIAGGGSIFNPEPIVDFIDCVIPGDGEEITPKLIKFIGAKRRDKISRDQLLKEIAKTFPTVYIPKFYEYNKDTGEVYPVVEFVPKKIKVNKLKQLLNKYYPDTPLIPLMNIAQNRFVVEIMRGCTRGCRFCQAGMIYRPVRERPPEDIASQVKKSFADTGYKELSLLSLSTSDYNGLEKSVCSILDGRQKNSMSISFPSMRLDSFSDKVAEYAKQTKKSGLTFAPEAGSQRLRNSINKDISEKELLDSVKIAVDNGWQLVKLYFMIGLPNETMADILAIADLVKKVLHAGGKQLRVNVTLSSFIPKVFTPFQWEKQDSPKVIQEKIDTVKPLLRKMKRVKVMSRDPRYSQLEGLMSRGDRRLSQLIFYAWKKGAKFDGWREFYNFDLWEETLDELELDLADYTGSKSTNASLPWEIIDPLISKQYLLKERKKAAAETTTPDCRFGCTGCALCQDDLQMDLVKKEQGFPFNYIDQAAEQSDKKYRYRLNFVKTGAAKFTSHLDIIRIFKQALKGAQLNLCYTGGYNKKPKISAGFPLPYSFTSDDEYIDVFLKNPVDQLDSVLNQHLPEGLKVKNFSVLDLKRASVSSLVTGFIYEIRFIDDIPQNIPSAVEQLLKAKTLPVKRVKKRKRKTIDAATFINHIEIKDQHLLLTLNVIDGRTVKVREVLNLLNIQQEDCYVLRKKTLFSKEFYK